MRMVLEIASVGVLIAIAISTIIFAVFCIKENFKK